MSHKSHKSNKYKYCFILIYFFLSETFSAYVCVNLLIYVFTYVSASGELNRSQDKG